MIGGDVDISEMNEDQMELLLRRIEERKRMKRGRTPDPAGVPNSLSPEPADYRPEQTHYRQQSSGYRQEPTYREEQPSYRQNYRQEQPLYRQEQQPLYREEQPSYGDERTPYRQDPVSYRTPQRNQYTPESAYNTKNVYPGLTADSDSDDLASLESFISSNLTPDLPDEEWLFVSPASRPSEQQRRVRVADWLRMGSEDEFDGTQGYKPRATECRKSTPPSAAVSRSKSPMGQIPDILGVSAPSRYTEQMERRNYTEFQNPRPVASSPFDPALRGSPDWTREGVAPRGPDQTSGHRFSPQATAANSLYRRDSPVIPARESPSPKLSGGRTESPLGSMSPSFQRAPRRPPSSDGADSSEEPVYVPSTTPDRERQLRRELPDPRAPQTEQSRGVTPPQIGRPGIRPPGLARPLGGIRAPQAPSGLKQPRSVLPSPALSRARRPAP